MKLKNYISFSSAFLLFFLTTIFLFSCQNKKENNENSSGEKIEEIKKEAPPINKSENKSTNYERLDDIELFSMKKFTTKTKEAGDCENHTTRYEGKNMTLLIDSVDCFDYGKTFTYFLLNDTGEIRKVHSKEITPFYEEKNGVAQFYFSLSETFVDFDETHAKATFRTDTILQRALKRKVVYDENYQSEPWIVLNKKGGDMVNGEKVNYEGEWYKAIKNKLKARLSKMKELPLEIPTKTNGTVGMGHRGEYRSMCEEAIQEVAAEREKTPADPFDLMENPFSNFENAGEKSSIGYWKKVYQSALH